MLFLFGVISTAAVIRSIENEWMHSIWKCIEFIYILYQTD